MRFRSRLTSFSFLFFFSRLHAPDVTNVIYDQSTGTSRVTLPTNFSVPLYLVPSYESRLRVLHVRIRATAVPASETKLYAQRIADLYLDSYLVLVMRYAR